MSVEIDVDGDAYEVPSSARDANWASKLTAFFQGLAAALNTAITSLAALTATVAALATAVGAKAWTHPAWENAWDEFGPGDLFKYQKDNTGRIWLRGGASAGLSGTVMTTLAVGNRPASEVLLLTPAAGGVALITIGNNGTVTVSNFTAGCNVSDFVTFNGLSFTTNA